jgi:hypothetical protein
MTARGQAAGWGEAGWQQMDVLTRQKSTARRLVSIVPIGMVRCSPT